MRRSVAWPLLVVMLLGLVSLGAPAAAGPGEAQVAPDAEAQFVARINELRRSKGALELTTDEPLVDLARRWAASMAAAGAISHNPNLRAELPEPWERAGENVGVGPSVESLYNAFVASPNHYRILVEPRYTRVGVGVVRTADGTLYTTHLFVQPPPPAVPPRPSRSRAPAAAPAPEVKATTPAAIGGSWSASSLRPTVSLTSVSSFAGRDASSGVARPALIGCLVAVLLLLLVVRVDRRRAARREVVAPPRPLGATLDRYTATALPALPLTTGLRWMPAPPGAVDEGVGAIATTLAPYAVSQVATGWRLEELADELDGVVIVASIAGRVRYASPATERILGYGRGELIGWRLADLVHADDTPRLLDVDESRAADLRLRHRGGSWRHVEVTAEDRHDDPGIAGIVLRGADVTELRVVEAEMRNRVDHDPVTGVLGRPMLLERLAHAIAALDNGAESADGAEGVTVLAVRLGGLEVVHEAHGPVIVDCLVGAAADRLQQELGPTVVLGRYGDHDFVVVAPTAGDAATTLAQAALDALREPFVALVEPVALAPSVGVAVVERSDVPAARAMQQAYVAMRNAQRRGGERVEVFQPSLSGHAVSRLRDERALRRALEHDELCMQYQPIVRVTSGGMSGVEALMRWRHPERGLVTAAQFIGVAEESGLIGEMGWWALRTACAEAARWSRMAPSFRVSVNVSARQLANPGFADVVFGALAEAQAPASSLCLELTEASLLNDMDEGAARLQAVREGGVTVAVDDFGTGYSSLGYLQQLPIDTVKIDRSFVSDLGHTAAGETIASAVVGLAHGLGLATVAEGVETEAQAGTLATLGCDHLQGYLCSAARPAEEIDELFGAPLVAGLIDLRDAAENGALTAR